MPWIAMAAGASRESALYHRLFRGCSGMCKMRSSAGCVAAAEALCRRPQRVVGLRTPDKRASLPAGWGRVTALRSPRSALPENSPLRAAVVLWSL